MYEPYTNHILTIINHHEPSLTTVETPMTCLVVCIEDVNGPQVLKINQFNQQVDQKKKQAEDSEAGDVG